MLRYALLLLIPLSLGLRYFGDVPPVWMFVVSGASVAILAEWIRRATEQLAGRVGPAIGGLLTISFGSIAELVLAIFVLANGGAAVAQAQISGSIIGTSLFGLGLAILIGGLSRNKQSFDTAKAGLLSTLLILVVISIMLPSVFDLAIRLKGAGATIALTDEELSLGVSVVLVVLYLGNLVYTLITHRDVFASREAPEEAVWGTWTSVVVIVAATAAVTLEAEMVSEALTETASVLNLSPIFLGIIVLGLLGTISDLFAAAWFAHKDRMGLVLSICIGSAIQMALVVAPVLVLASWLMGHPMSLVFADPLQLFAIAATGFIVSAVVRDGETNWFEGLLLVGIYCLFGLAFFFSS